ncbi:MAG: hypothetical protein RID53_33855 [Coleofasciculus sp. B1-GNL1-01]
MALKETCDRAVCSSLFVVATLVVVCALNGVERWCDRVSQKTRII